MPLPHRSPPRRRDRRSRSRSHSPRRRRSRSHSRDRRRSRSPQRRRSPERKFRSPPRRKSPSPRRRSRSPKRRSRSHSPRRRSRSHSPRRKGHSPRRSPSPARREHPVKRPADSSGKRPGFRSRTPSPSPIKRSRDERLYEDEKLYQQQQRSNQARSPIHESQYGGKMYADQASSSKQPLFPSGSSKKFGEIDYVTIVEKGPRKLKLDKRFETLEEAAQGAFEFDENITIGIHRGPQHIQLDDDEDIEVNYGFNPKTFKMLHAKKNYNKEIFDRDEIKVFRHDDNLDEEAYVEKRTISVKPVDKPKSRKYNEEFDYKITVGSSREGYGDRRMVQDSGSRSRPSRSGAYDDIPVTVRLDPKPDPRYEKIYKDQQRYEDQSLIRETVQRNPNDLRYNLMRRKSDGDRDGGRDGRERQSTMMDARSRIEARRQGHPDDYSDRRDRSAERRGPQGSPPRRIERKNASVKTDLPDFKNRPVKYLDRLGKSTTQDDYDLPPDHRLRHGKISTWGHCSICNVPLTSEQQAVEHVNGKQHCDNEKAQRYGSSENFSARPIDTFSSRSNAGKSDWHEFGKHRESSLQRLHRDDLIDRKRHRSNDSDFDRIQVKRRSINKDVDLDVSDGDDFDEQVYADSKSGLFDDSKGQTLRSSGQQRSSSKQKVWIIGTDEMKALHEYRTDSDLGISECNIIWKCNDGLSIADVLPIITKLKTEEANPDCIVLHVGINDLEKSSRFDFKDEAFEMIDEIQKQFPDVKLAWSQLLPKLRTNDNERKLADDAIATHVLEAGGHYIHYPAVVAMDRSLFRMTKTGKLEMSRDGKIKMQPILRGALISIMRRNLTIVPVLKNLPTNVSNFVNKNMKSKFYPRNTRTISRPSYFKKKFTFARRK